MSPSPVGTMITAVRRSMERVLRSAAVINAYIGHGRALESALIFVKLEFGLMLILAPTRPFIVALNDVQLSQWLLSLPFLISGCTSLVGLVLNAKGYRCSRIFRIVGATIGMTCWIYIVSKSVLVGLPFSGMNPWCVMGILGSIWIIRRGALGQPPEAWVPDKVE